MKDCRRFALLVAFIATILIAEVSLASARTAPFIAAPEVQIGLGLSRPKISGGETITGRVEVRRNGNTQELLFRLEISNTNLVRLSTSEIRLKPDESSALFEIASTSTPIKTSVNVKAFLQPADQVQTQKTLEIVPALLKGVTLNQPMLPGTHGGRIGVRAELNANAPVGGIELYLDMIAPAVPGKLLRLDSPNPRVGGGSKEVTFDIAYDRIYIGDEQVSRDRTSFNEQTRTVDLVVSLETQSSKPWQAIPGIANKVSFDVIPLRVASISVQPTAVTGGGESLASFTLNIPPGSSETVRLTPTSGATSLRPAWARLLGTSCQTNVLQLLELQLTQGVTNYSFKVCTAPVTTATTGTLNVITRSASFPVQIAIQP